MPSDNKRGLPAIPSIAEIRSGRNLDNLLMRNTTRLLGIFIVVLSLASTARAVEPDVIRRVHEQVASSLVAVKLTVATEIRKFEIIGPGIVVDDTGLVMTSLAMVDPRIPDEQLEEFKIIVPNVDQDDDEVNAVFLGRDERTNLAFMRADADPEKPRTWKPIKFEDVPVEIGQPVLSVGLMPKSGGYRAYVTHATVAAALRGPVPQVLVSGMLAGFHSPVLNEQGQAIGIVSYSQGQPVTLNDQRNDMAAINTPPRMFVPARDFLQSLSDVPTEGQPLRMPYMGVRQMTGLTQDVAEFYGLANQPAVEVGDVVANTPAAVAGLRPGDVIVKINDEPIERGDAPEELPQIVARKLGRMKVGEQIKLSVLRGRAQPLQDIQVTLDERPLRANRAKRFYAEDLGFSIRDVVFDDRYDRRLSDQETGVIVAMIRPQAAAQSARLQNDDLILQLNGENIRDVTHFREMYEAFRKEKPRDAVVMVVQREGRADTIRIEPPQ